MMCHRIGFPPISTIGLGLLSVSSERRVPRTPARMTAFFTIEVPTDSAATVVTPNKAAAPRESGRKTDEEELRRRMRAPAAADDPAIDPRDRSQQSRGWP